MSLVVTGISQSDDTKPIESALREVGLPLEGLVVFSAGDAREEYAESGIRFIYTGSDTVRTILGTGSIAILSMGGVEVPGVTSDDPPPEYFREESITDELSELEIPDSELDNYVEAIDAGRSVLAYYAEPATVAAAEDAFRRSGLANVRTF